MVLALPRPACAEMSYPVAPDLEIAPYGQLHFAYHSFDDGQAETANIVDITNSNSRIGFYLRAPERSDGLSFHFESGLGFHPSLKTSPNNTPEFWILQLTGLYLRYRAFAYDDATAVTYQDANAVQFAARFRV